MAIINQARLKQYLNLNYNVLLIAPHGVGKTTVIKQVFTEAFGDNWKYFSASTMDVWVDLIGIPRGVDKDGKEVLEFIRPEFLENVEAIMFDEFNRAPDKVLNAVMEITQFRSINGIPLPNLKVVWASCNPEDDDDTYSVNHLDPAHLDRFHVQINVPFMVDEEYFNGKYPATGPLFIQWWKALPTEIQKLVSPRRLDYAADAHSHGCRLEDFLPNTTNVKALRTILKSAPFVSQLNAINDEAAAEAFIRDINHSTTLLDMVKSNDSAAIGFFMKYGKLLPKELVEPFADFVHARASGLEFVTSLEELINKLPNEKGNQGTAAIINNVSLDALYKAGGSLENDLRGLFATKKNTIMKLTNQCSDVLINCQHKTLDRVLWGVAGKTANKPTNFHQIIKVLSKVGGCFGVKQTVMINDKLYRLKLVDDMNFL
jgi:hypothetical protein